MDTNDRRQPTNEAVTKRINVGIAYMRALGVGAAHKYYTKCGLRDQVVVRVLDGQTRRRPAPADTLVLETSESYQNGVSGGD